MLDGAHELVAGCQLLTIRSTPTVSTSMHRTPQRKQPWPMAQHPRFSAERLWGSTSAAAMNPPVRPTWRCLVCRRSCPAASRIPGAARLTIVHVCHGTEDSCHIKRALRLRRTGQGHTRCSTWNQVRAEVMRHWQHFHGCSHEAHGAHRQQPCVAVQFMQCDAHTYQYMQCAVLQFTVHKGGWPCACVVCIAQGAEGPGCHQHRTCHRAPGDLLDN